MLPKATGAKQAVGLGRSRTFLDLPLTIQSDRRDIEERLRQVVLTRSRI
jgi:hypothetical protein